MEEWSDQGIVLSARSHGEGGAVLSLLTEKHGRHNGYLHGAKSSRLRGMIEPGSLLDVTWKSRVSDQLGTYSFEHGVNRSAMLLDEPLKLSALLSACSLCDAALPEREIHAGLFYGMTAMMNNLQSEIWAAAYVMWEIALLKELGFGVDLTRCVAGGSSGELTHVSPKSGCAVSREKAEPYKDKLLKLPDFLAGRGLSEETSPDILDGLKLTGYFLTNWVFGHHSQGIPEARLRFQSLFAKTVADHIESAA
jgi:DNA repair protein RecO (recombination protein O)